MHSDSYLLDEAKIRQDSLRREAELAHLGRNLRRGHKPSSLAKKLRALLAAMS